MNKCPQGHIVYDPIFKEVKPTTKMKYSCGTRLKIRELDQTFLYEKLIQFAFFAKILSRKNY